MPKSRTRYLVIQNFSIFKHKIVPRRYIFFQFKYSGVKDRTSVQKNSACLLDGFMGSERPAHG